jgi:hypothetical protein
MVFLKIQTQHILCLFLEHKICKSKKYNTKNDRCEPTELTKYNFSQNGPLLKDITF